MAGGFPGGLVVASPVYEVLELAAAEAGVQYFFNNSFLNIVDNDGRSWGLSVSWQ